MLYARGCLTAPALPKTEASTTFMIGCVTTSVPSLPSPAATPWPRGASALPHPGPWLRLHLSPPKSGRTLPTRAEDSGGIAEKDRGGLQPLKTVSSPTQAMAEATRGGGTDEYRAMVIEF